MNTLQILLMNKQNIGNLGYGYLYNWYSINDINFTPIDWHVPTETEYDTLKIFLGDFEIAGGKMKVSGYTYWDFPNNGATNSSGFSAYGSGYRNPDGNFSSSKKYFNAWLYGINKYSMSLLWDSSWAFLDISENPLFGFSIRLVKNSTTLSDGETSTMIDYDGNIYDTICIGTQEWTVQNWKCTKLNNGTPLIKIKNNTTWMNATNGDLYYCAYDNNENYV